MVEEAVFSTNRAAKPGDSQSEKMVFCDILSAIGYRDRGNDDFTSIPPPNRSKAPSNVTHLELRKPLFLHAKHGQENPRVFHNIQNATLITCNAVNLLSALLQSTGLKHDASYARGVLIPMGRTD